MELNTEEKNEEVIVRFSGEIDMLSIKGMKDKLFALSEKNKNIIIDFANLDYLDSTGIGILLTLNRMQLDNNCTLTLVNVPEKIENILRLSSLNDILT